MNLFNPLNRPPAVITSANGAAAPSLTVSPSRRVGPATRPRTVLRIGLDTSQPDAYSIVSILQSLCEQFARQPAVREFTINDVLCDIAGNNDIDAHFARITQFVKDHVVYVRDPIGSEYVISPVNFIRQLRAGQTPAGDCDDHVLFLCSMLGSVGFPVKVVGVKLNNSPNFNHVIAAVYLNGLWQDVDPCAKEVGEQSYADKLVSA